MQQIVQWILEHTLWLLLAAGTVYSYSRLQDCAEKLNIGNRTAAVLALLHTVTGVVCVKVFAFLEGTPGGMSLYGGIFFMPVLYFAGAKLFRRDVRAVFDSFTFCMVFTLLCARVNCLLSGCCLGRLIPGSESLRWPTRQLEVCFYLAFLFYLWKRSKTDAFEGKFYPLFMMVYGVFRFIVEWFRVSDHIYGYLHISHFWSLVAIAIGAVFYFRPLNRAKQNENGAAQNNARSDRR